MYRDMEAGVRIAYVVYDQRARHVIGATSYVDIRPRHHSVSIGSSFLHPSVRGGPLNAEMKLLMFGHAFDSGAMRVEFFVAPQNHASRSALEKLGCQREGLLRKHWIASNGDICDSVVYSVTDDDWPTTEDTIRRQISRRAGQALTAAAG